MSPATAVQPVPIDHEELVVRRGVRSGVEMAIAVHSTVLGPALGGLRIWEYASTSDGVRDALRLSRAMTMKAAVAGLDCGGGKGVICASPSMLFASRRRETLLDFGDLVESLGGRYATAEDVGSGASDMATIAERTEHVAGLPVESGGSGDPSPYTAQGVEAAMRACARRLWGSGDLAGMRVAIVGVGHVGSALARRLAGQGAELIIADVVASRAALATELGGRWVTPEEALAADCEILAPCALGGAIGEDTIERLRCAAICGAANNQLEGESMAERLAARGILFAPDFVANAGGLISVYHGLRDGGAGETGALVDRIEDAMAAVFTEATATGVTPLEAAAVVAERRLAAAPLALGVPAALATNAA